MINKLEKSVLRGFFQYLKNNEPARRSYERGDFLFVVTGTIVAL